MGETPSFTNGSAVLVRLDGAGTVAGTLLLLLLLLHALVAWGLQLPPPVGQRREGAIPDHGEKRWRAFPQEAWGRD